MVQDIEKYLGASTSSGGARQLAEYMVVTFGNERANTKLRIESLEDLVKRGVDVPGHANPLSPKTEPGAAPEQTRAVPLPSSVRRERNRQVGIAVGLVVLASVTTAVLMKVLSPGRSASTDAGVVIRGTPVADASVEPFDAGEPEDAGVEVSDAGRAPAVVKPISLTPVIVQRGISQNKARFQKCFFDHRADLPSKSGAVMLRFVIASTGRVTEASTDLPGTSGASKCLEGVVKSITFPRNVDNGVRVPISLGYDLP
jgi:hypothetical protein